MNERKVEKERQERRKASLRRLMARKEQRALQQVGRTKRRLKKGPNRVQHLRKVPASYLMAMKYAFPERLLSFTSIERSDFSKK